ncbi:MAG: sigma-70 family RNA polymerase sigma factor [Candidatus Firestonebacteria bacterium]
MNTDVLLYQLKENMEENGITTDINIEFQIKVLMGNDNPAALEIIYDHLGNKIFHYLLCILCSKEKAEDVMQNLFVSIVEKRDKISKVSNITGYIFMMAKNQAIDYIRAAKKERIFKEEDLSNVLCLKEPDKEEKDKTIRKDIAEAINSLPLKQKEVISMKIFQEMTFEEISKTLNISINTISGRYRYGINKLRRKLRRFKYAN